MFTDWLDAGPLDYSSLAGAFAPWARGAASDAQAYPCRYLRISIVSVVEIVGFPWIRDSKPRISIVAMISVFRPSKYLKELK